MYVVLSSGSRYRILWQGKFSDFESLKSNCTVFLNIIVWGYRKGVGKEDDDIFL
jgi:hypothetical protein